ARIDKRRCDSSISASVNLEKLFLGVEIVCIGLVDSHISAVRAAELVPAFGITGKPDRSVVLCAADYNTRCVVDSGSIELGDPNRVVQLCPAAVGVGSRDVVTAIDTAVIAKVCNPVCCVIEERMRNDYMMIAVRRVGAVANLSKRNRSG